jgi:alkylation response protein AidB-like acyl-CoA dehydrogenase
MDFRHAEDPLLFQETVRDFLAKECAPETVRAIWESKTGRSPALWKKLAEIGVTGLLAPE